jgi:hypothetical protein
VDDTRRREEALRLDEVPEAAYAGAADEMHVERSVMQREGRQRFWQLLETRLKDERERRLVYGLFVLDLKPRQLLEEFNGLFRDVQEIYRLKENVMERLRRDSDFQDALNAR